MFESFILLTWQFNKQLVKESVVDIHNEVLSSYKEEWNYIVTEKKLMELGIILTTQGILFEKGKGPERGRMAGEQWVAKMCEGQ